MSLNTAKCICSGKLPFTIDYPMTRNMLRIRIAMKNIPHHPGKVPIPQMQSNLPIRGNLSPRNVLHKFIHFFFHHRNFYINEIIFSLYNSFKVCSIALWKKIYS